MKYRTRLVVGCAIAAALVTSVAAQDALARRVSLDLKAMAPADAFGTLASSVGLKAVVDPAVTAPVDILVRNVSARTALTTMCESIGCEWTVAAGTLSVKPAGERRPGTAWIARDRSGSVVSSSSEASRFAALMKQPLPAGMKFENAPLATVNERLSQALGIRVTLSTTDPALKTVTIDFSQKSLMTGLKELGEIVGGDFRLAARIDKGSTGKELSPSIMIAIGKPGQVKK
jgi:type II secretory pathway component GspD/PulD (secretin)